MHPAPSRHWSDTRPVVGRLRRVFSLVPLPPATGPLILTPAPTVKCFSLYLATARFKSTLFRPRRLSHVQNLHKKALDLCGPSYGGVDVVDLGRVIVRLRERLETGVSSKKVFCHNDLQVHKEA